MVQESQVCRQAGGSVSKMVHMGLSALLGGSRWPQVLAILLAAALNNLLDEQECKLILRLPMESRHELSMCDS